MRHFFFFLSTLCFLTISQPHAMAQNGLEDVVYLTDGSIYRGIIVEQVPNVSLKIQIMGGSVVAVQMTNVVKMTKEAAVSLAPIKLQESETTLSTAPETAPAKREKIPFEPRKKGYFFQGQLLLENLQGGLRVVNGYKFGRFGHLGIGVGFDGVGGSPFNNLVNDLDMMSLSGLYLPLYVYYAGDILNRKVTPFYAIEAGYAQPVTFGRKEPMIYEDFYPEGGSSSSTVIEGGGVMGSVGLGLRFNTRRRINFSLLFNVNVKTVRYSENYYLYDDVLYSYDLYSSTVRTATLIIPGIRFGIGF